MHNTAHVGIAFLNRGSDEVSFVDVRVFAARSGAPRPAGFIATPLPPVQGWDQVVPMRRPVPALFCSEINTFPPQKPKVWYYSQPASGVAVDATGNVYLTNRMMGLIPKVARKDQASHSTRHHFINLDDVGFEVFGVLVVFGNGKDSPREESELSSELTTVAGQDGTYRSRDGYFASATFREPSSLAVSQTGEFYVLEPAENQIRKIRFPKSKRR